MRARAPPIARLLSSTGPPELYQARLLLAEGLLRLGRRDLAENQFREVLATLASGLAHPLTSLGDLPLPTPERAGRRSREVLGQG